MVGGFSFDQSKFNRATQALRQPGSSFKPFVYATALDNGYTPSTLVLDAPIEINAGPGQEIWRPENFDKQSYGLRTLRYGIEHSKNQMTVRLAQDIGMPLVADYAQRFGLYNNLLPVLAMSLGAGETTVLKVTSGYSMFVNGGTLQLDYSTNNVSKINDGAILTFGGGTNEIQRDIIGMVALGLPRVNR